MKALVKVINGIRKSIRQHSAEFLVKSHYAGGHNIVCRDGIHYISWQVSSWKMASDCDF